MPILRLDAFARGQLTARLHRVASQFSRAQEDADADAVHDLRVAIRRFLQVLSVFEALLPGKEVASARRKLRRLLKAAGEVRDLDVGAVLAGPRSPESIRKAFSAARWKAAARLDRRLRLAEHRQWTERWHGKLLLADAPKPAAAFVQDLLPPMEENFRTQGDAAAGPGTPAESLHRFRIACKRLRYSMELFEPLDPAGFAPRIEAIRQAQQILGDANDCAVTAELLAEFGGAPAIEKRLTAKHRRLATQFRRNWPEIRAAAFPCLAAHGS
ncbi:MAG: CHAD domain-containing protein, partial [Bryobacteraceae bacterium]